MSKRMLSRIDSLEGGTPQSPTVFFWEGGRAKALAEFWLTHDKAKHPERSLNFLEFRWAREGRAAQ